MGIYWRENTKRYSKKKKMRTKKNRVLLMCILQGVFVWKLVYCTFTFLKSSSKNFQIPLIWTCQYHLFIFLLSLLFHFIIWWLLIFVFCLCNFQHPQGRAFTSGCLASLYSNFCSCILYLNKEKYICKLVVIEIVSPDYLRHTSFL